MISDEIKNIYTRRTLPPKRSICQQQDDISTLEITARGDARVDNYLSRSQWVPSSY